MHYYHYNTRNLLTRSSRHNKKGTVMNDKLKRIYIPMTETGFYILYCLQEKNHGYNIGLQVKQMTGGELTISPGTMYGTLSKMEQEADTTLFGDHESKLELCKRVVHGQFLRMLPFILLFPSILNL